VTTCDRNANEMKICDIQQKDYLNVEPRSVNYHATSCLHFRLYEFSGSRLKTHLFSRSFPDLLYCLYSDLCHDRKIFLSFLLLLITTAAYLITIGAVSSVDFVNTVLSRNTVPSLPLTHRYSTASSVPCSWLSNGWHCLLLWAPVTRHWRAKSISLHTNRHTHVDTSVSQLHLLKARL